MAKVDGTEITDRELKEEIGAVSNGLAMQDRETRNAILERLVMRKVFANEARERGLERDGAYHFALRRARDELLAEALQRQIRQTYVPEARIVRDHIAATPWRFENRAILALRPLSSSSDADEYAVDSRTLNRTEAISVSDAKIGDKVTIAGQQWVVSEREIYEWSGDEMETVARQDVIDREVENRMRRIWYDYAQRGKVRYQEGYGPSAR